MLLKGSVNMKQLVPASTAKPHTTQGSIAQAGKPLHAPHIFLPAHPVATLGIVTKTNTHGPKGLNCDPGRLAALSLLESGWICWGHRLFGFTGTLIPPS